MTTTPDVYDGLKQAVRTSIDQLGAAYADTGLRVVPDGQGGGWIALSGLPLGASWAQGNTFLICLLPFSLPACDIYPMFVRPDLCRADGGGLGDPALQVAALSWPGDPQQRQVVQVSRRTRGGAFVAQTAPQKVEKVMDWLRSL